MTKNLYYDTNEQEWNLEKRLKAKGYLKTGECFWCQTFKKDNKEIVLNRI